MAFKVFFFFSVKESFMCVLLPVLGASSEVRQFFLQQASGQDCQTLQLGESWIFHFLIDCHLECTRRYSENCQSVVFNSQTGNCTPGSIAFGPIEKVTTSIPETGSSDKLYYVRQPIPPCNTSNNFALYDVCGTSACLYLSAPDADSYSHARTTCSQMNSRLFVGNTMAKYSLFLYICDEYLRDGMETYLGLQDIDSEGNFVWENGEPLSPEQNQYIWNTDEPNDGAGAGSEDCVEWPKAFGLNDEQCHDHNHYICERCQEC